MPAAPPESDRPDAPRDGLFIRVYFGEGRFIGPGKIELLETIRSERSILSAARAIGMSYRRAWLLVDEINRMFAQPAVVTFPGRRGHGTELTAFGERLIALYRSIERSSTSASEAAVQELRAALAAGAQESVRPAPRAEDAPLRSAPGRRRRAP